MQEDKGDVMFFLERKPAREGSGKRQVVYGNEKAFLSMSIPCFPDAVSKIARFCAAF